MRDDDPQHGLESGDPLDLAALRADDAFLEQFALGHPPSSATGDPVEDELAAMFTAWVHEVRPATAVATPEIADEGSAPVAEEPVTELIAAPAAAPLSPRRGGSRHAAARTPLPHLRRFAVAATIIAMAGSGLALGAWDAEPGEILWPVTKVFYAEKARSVEAAVDVTTLHETARAAIARGDRPAAAAALVAAGPQIDEVRPEEGHDDLVRMQSDLTGAVSGEPTVASPGSGPTGEATAAGPAPTEAPPAPGAAAPAPAGRGRPSRRRRWRLRTPLRR
ncbi:MAG: hypothetical protein L0H84_16230, partial [Pseudonocardia sp.]|nr:hypothetical protein [Pseudonocardia sp.]